MDGEASAKVSGRFSKTAHGSDRGNAAGHSGARTYKATGHHVRRVDVQAPRLVWGHSDQVRENRMVSVIPAQAVIHDQEATLSDSPFQGSAMHHGIRMMRSWAIKTRSASPAAFGFPCSRFDDRPVLCRLGVYSAFCRRRQRATASAGSSGWPHRLMISPRPASCL